MSTASCASAMSAESLRVREAMVALAAAARDARAALIERDLARFAQCVDQTFDLREGLIALEALCVEMIEVARTARGERQLHGLGRGDRRGVPGRIARRGGRRRAQDGRVRGRAAALGRDGAGVARRHYARQRGDSHASEVAGAPGPARVDCA